MLKLNIKINPFQLTREFWLQIDLVENFHDGGCGQRNR